MAYNELRQHGTENYPVEFYHIDRPHPKYEMAYHWHSELELIRIISGKLFVSLDNKEYEASAGDVIFVNSETVHGAVPEDCVYECIVFNAQYLSATNPEIKSFMDDLMSHSAYVSELHRKTDGIQETAERLFDAVRDEKSASAFFVTGLFYELFGIIYRDKLYSRSIQINSFHNEKNVVTLKKALAFIRKSYDSQITLEEIAAEVGFSPKYLCAFFKEMTGKTPFEYLNLYRVERAARKLMNSDAPVTQVAYSCGFNDLSYFIRLFKKIKGVTPKNFRKGVEKEETENAGI